MTKNPFINAFTAALYICLISLIMNMGSKYAPKEDTFAAPVAFISLFTLSAAVMAYVFCLQPLQLFLSGKKSQAIKLFLQTVAIFALITALLLIAVFTGII